MALIELTLIEVDVFSEPPLLPPLGSVSNEWLVNQKAADHRSCQSSMGSSFASEHLIAVGHRQSLISRPTPPRSDPICNPFSFHWLLSRERERERKREKEREREFRPPVSISYSIRIEWFDRPVKVRSWFFYSSCGLSRSAALGLLVERAGAL